jgi:trigger factor
MEITKESIGELNEVVSIQLKPEDYKDKVDASIKKTRKGMSVPGFRQGHVPEGMVRKMYGKAILADELNKIVSESLNNFLLENKINILGNPLPVKENENGNGSKNNWENPSEFEFKFELGLVPQFNLTLPPDHVFPYYEIAVDDSKVNEYIEDIKKRYGKHSQPDNSDANSVLYASFTEVDSNNAPVESGITTQTTLAIDLVKDKADKKNLVGLKKDDTVIIDIVKAMNNETEVSHMLKIAKDKVADVKNNFELKIISVNNVENAELNQELFDKVYGVDAVKSEEEFREKLKAEIFSMFAVESERKLQHDVQDELLNKFKVNLPDDFLKRWLLDANDKPITEERVEKEYNAYSTGMKWKLIEGNIVRQNNIRVTEEEIQNYSKQLIVNQFAQYGSSYLTDEMIDGMIKRYLDKEENVNQVVESLTERKVFNYLSSIVKKDVKKVSYDEFLKVVKEHKH